MGGDTGLADMTFGSMAGMVAKVFEHPFDLVKVRLQSQPTDRPLSFTGPFDCFKQTYMKEGLRGLYRGISAPIAGAACENASLFLVYGKCQEAIYYLRLRAEGQAAGLSIGELAVAGAGAGAVTSFVLTPIELIKCRMQVQMLAREGAFGAAAESASVAAASSSSSSSSSASSASSSSSRAFSTSSLARQQLHAPPPSGPASAPSGPLTLIMQTLRTQGIRGLWLGQTGTLFRETGGSAAWFGAYELSTRLWLKHYHLPTNLRATKADLTSLQLMASGALAGVSYNVILFPADSVKSTMQTWAELNPHAPATQKASFVGTFKTIWRTRGIRGLYAGCGLTCLRSGPSSAMIFLIYQRLEQNFGYIFGLDA